jgi:hypothetical protein
MDDVLAEVIFQLGGVPLGSHTTRARRHDHGTAPRTEDQS